MPEDAGLHHSSLEIDQFVTEAGYTRVSIYCTVIKVARGTLDYELAKSEVHDRDAGSHPSMTRYFCDTFFPT